MLKLFIILNLFYLYKSIRISHHPESQIGVRGSSVKFTCEYTNEDAYSHSHVTIQWLYGHNEQQFVPVHNSDTVRVAKNTLTILSFEPEAHAGEYKCLVNSSNMAVLSRPANLSLAVLEPFDSNLNENQVITMSEGNVAIITCNLPYSNPSAVPVFYLNDELLPIAQNRYKIFASGNLQIFNVRQSDSGVYKCSAKNLITNEMVHSSRRTTLKVYEPIGTKLPEIIYVPSDATRVKVGANLTLECVANGAPVPLVSWEKFGGILPAKRSVQIFGNLMIINVQPEDKGTYVCRAENGPGQATFKTAMIDVHQPPYVQKDKKLVFNAKKSDSIDLTCPIMSNSQPSTNYQWFYNGFSLPKTGSNHKIKFKNEHSILSLRGANNQAGMYQCLAKNEFGLAQADLLLNLESDSELPKRPVIIMGPQNTTIYEGQSVVLLCVTSETSSGNVQINWLQNDLIIEPTLMRRFEINQLLGNLRIVSVQKSDAGLYKCIASNEFGMSTAEAFVHVKSIDDDKIRQLRVESAVSRQTSSVGSRPIVEQIGTDKILLKWQLIDSIEMKPVEHDTQVAYFKVEYKTNRQQIPGVQPYTWLTIDEQIDARKREYILTDLASNELYRFRLSTFYLNGQVSHSHASAKFRLDQSWQAKVSKVSKTSSAVSYSSEFKLGHIQVQISQIWAISATSLGLKWNLLASDMTNISLKINGFYIYYRKIDQTNNEQIPLYNYTRINVPLTNEQTIDSYLIANLDESSQYEIKMTCFNLNGDLCSFSNPIYGLTLTPAADYAKTTKSNQVKQDQEQQQQQQQNLTTAAKHSEILFMILGAVLGVLSLLLVGFVIMCVLRNRQHKKLLSQLHTSHKLASSSCPTLIYEDSLRQNNRVNMYIGGNNDSNSTNSQSMSTTTSSITTPPEHLLLLNGNTVSTNSFANLPPPIPQVPPPGTMNRININMNPLNGYLEAKNENFYHTLTQMGNLPDKSDADYNNASINMRNLILKQQQQQQQILMNTLKNLNMQYQINDAKSVRSPSIKRSASGSRKSKKAKSENRDMNSHQQPQQQQQQQQQANYYLLPNCLATQPIIYNDMDLINAAFLNQNLANGNLLFLNHHHQQQQQQNQLSSFQQVSSPVNANLMDLFDKANEEIASDLNAVKNERVYEQTESKCEESEPMLSNHYATSEINKTLEDQS